MGIIELHGKSSTTAVEDLLLFLYGKKPKIGMNNIGDLLELADFFMLPTVKANCVKWLKAQQASRDTFFKFLHLANLYNIELPYLEEYMRGNMIELLDEDDAVSLETTTLAELLNDKDLTYIPVDVWFKFLVKWTKADLGRDACFQELFPLLDLEDIDQELHQVICNDTLVVRLCQSTLDKITPSLGETAQVVIFPGCYSRDNVTCFYIQTGKWYIISLEQGFPLNKVVSVKDKASSILYSLTNKYGATQITFHDLSNQNQSCPPTKLIDIEDRKEFKTVDGFAMAGSTCYLVKGKLAKTKSKYIYVTNLYKGEFQVGETIFEPIACFKEKYFSYLAADMNDNVALLLEEKDEVIIFNDVHGCLESINLKEHDTFKCDYDGSTFAAREAGFLIKNRKQMCFITPVQGLSLRERFKVTCVDLPTLYRHWSTYIVCGDICFRFEKSGNNADYTFRYIDLDTLLNTTIEDAEWLTKELPNSCKRNFVDFVGISAFLVSLPKRLLRCSLGCPHCKATKTIGSIGRVNSPQESYYDDSDDSDYDNDSSPVYVFEDDYAYYDSSD